MYSIDASGRFANLQHDYTQLAGWLYAQLWHFDLIRTNFSL